MLRALIVAKFNEDISWLSTASGYQAIVYSKLPNETDSSLPTLPNIGREAHTYLHYITSHYDSLPDLMVFTQANPFDHSPNFISRISKLESPLGYLPLSDTEAIFDAYGYPQLSASPLSLSKLCFGEFFEKLLGLKPPALFYSRMNALFAVDRETVRKRPLEFYMRCLTSLQDPTVQEASKWIGFNSVEPHFFERLWYFIFNPEWNTTGAQRIIHGITEDRLKLVMPLLNKWPQEVRESGPLSASRVLLAASELLGSSPTE